MFRRSSLFVRRYLICQLCIYSFTGLQSLRRPYKYTTTAILMQKNGAGLASAASTYWDAERDGLCKVMWENQTMHCVVTVFGTCVETGVNVEEEGDKGEVVVQKKE